MSIGLFTIAVAIVTFVVTFVLLTLCVKPWKLKRASIEFWGTIATSAIIAAGIFTGISVSIVEEGLFDLSKEGGELVSVCEEVVERIAIREDACEVTLALTDPNGTKVERVLVYEEGHYVLKESSSISIKEYVTEERLYSTVIPFVYRDVEYTYEEIACPKEVMESLKITREEKK